MEATQQKERRLSMIAEGNRLEIITTKICDGEWTLCVENCHGVRSVWFECFTSADAAIAEARRTIEDEGVDVFTDIEDFGYLL